ncbi:MAG: signal peptide peptidase SppA [Clostridiales bacterium]
MKQFFKFMFASMLGTILVFVLASLAFFTFLILIVSGVQKERVESISPNTVLEIKLDYPLPDRTIWEPFSGFRFNFRLNKQIGLNTVLANIRKAKIDNDIKGIYLNLNDYSAGGLATTEAIRKELLSFRQSGKFIIAYGEMISQSAYYLASAADKIYMPPTGNFEFKGLSLELTFFKNTLQKLEIEPQIFHYGKYKSAIEPFKLDKMSSDNRLATSSLLSSVYTNMLNNIASSRNLSYDFLKDAADKYLIQFPEDAKKYKFIDSLVYYDQVLDELKSKSAVRSDRKLRTVSIEDYTDVKGRERSSSSNKIAVIYANGEIRNTDGDESTIGAKNITEAIRKARNDQSIKAIVMRVNSPGGDALVADIIWREVTLARQKKPFIISMGNYAASGGYYISCAADSIVAEPTTITGSIGVFGIVPNMQNFFKNKLGITFDRVTTGKHSDFGSITRPLSADEKQILQKQIDHIYETFVNKVAQGRKKTFQQIHEIAQGRVWTGLQAKENGLVDVIGGLDDAIRIAAQKARIKQYRTVEYPGVKGLMEKVMQDFASEAEAYYLKVKLGENYKYFNKIEQIDRYNGIQARIPFDVDIH